MDWKSEYKNSYRTALDLFKAGHLTEMDIPLFDGLLEKYQFLLPKYYSDLIDKTNPTCPIRLQAIPRLEELSEAAGFLGDPFNDLKYRPAKRITHRYQNRLLFQLTSNCSMYCRFCFRKTLLNEKANELFEGGYEEGLEYIRASKNVEEVIFSGGDPFLASEAVLAQILVSINEMDHIERVRFHTRVPVTFPIRVDSDFIKILKLSKKDMVVVMHFNHPKELTSQAYEAVHMMKQNGITLLNQSVLLKNVNDSAEILIALSKKLFQFGIQPYYLHHPDKSAGTQHFDISMEEGVGIYTEVQKRLSGYLVPKYVVDTGDIDFKKSVKSVQTPFKT